MSLVLIEGWDSLAAVADAYGTTGSPTLNSITKRTGSQSLELSNSYDHCSTPQFPLEDTYIVGYAIYCETFDNEYHVQSQIWIYAASALNLNIIIDRNGLFRVQRYGTHLATSSSGLSTSTWHYVEIKVTCKNSISADDFIIKVDGVEVLNLVAGTDTQLSATQGVDQFTFAGGYNAIGNWFIDDLYICDLNGGVNDDFLGDVQVETLYPDGNGNTNDFVGSDADSTDNYLLVDEPQQNADVDYTESDTPTELDLYTFDDMADAGAEVVGVGVRAYVKKSDSGARTGKHQARISGTNYEGDEFSPAESYENMDYIWDEDPDTSSTWIKSGIDASEFGLKVHS